MIGSKTSLVLFGLLPLSLGCGYVRDARLCVKAGEALRGVSARPEKLEADPEAIEREAVRWGTLRGELERLASASPKSLSLPLRALAKESGLIHDTLERAREAVSNKNPTSYQAQVRSLDATRRRLENVTRDLKRVCGAQ